MKNDLAFGRIPVKASGSATTYEADGLWFNGSSPNYAMVGGNFHDSLLDGPMCAYLIYAAGFTNPFVGAALSCKPLAV